MKLIKLQLQQRNHTKYILFRGTNPVVRLRILYLNNLRNIEGKYKIFESLDINKKFTIREIEYWIKDYLLALKFNITNLFVAAE